MRLNILRVYSQSTACLRMYSLFVVRQPPNNSKKHCSFGTFNINSFKFCQFYNEIQSICIKIMCFSRSLLWRDRSLYWPQFTHHVNQSSFRLQRDIQFINCSHCFLCESSTTYSVKMSAIYFSKYYNCVLPASALRLRNNIRHYNNSS